VEISFGNANRVPPRDEQLRERCHVIDGHPQRLPDLDGSPHAYLDDRCARRSRWRSAGTTNERHFGAGRFRRRRARQPVDTLVERSLNGGRPCNGHAAICSCLVL
jgi:hypothetical protein